MNTRASSLHNYVPEQPRVLLVDDDDVNLLLTSVALRERGFSVTEATSGERAIRMLADWLPDVVVLDYIMPGVSGADVAREILAEAPDQVVLFVSGFSRTDAIAAVAPDAPLLTKPFRAEALDAAVREAIKNRRCRAI